jgi:tetratricopeptide (TPR) repeat protein
MSAAVAGVGPGERVRAAIRLVAQSKLDDAEALLRETLSRQPQDPWALNALGGVALVRQDVETARRLIGAAATIRPDEPEILANLSGLHCQSGAMDDALICLDRAVALAPGHAGIRRQRAELLLSLSRAHDAAGEAQRALELDSDSVGAWVTRGLVAIAQREPALAIACLREATLLDEGCVEAWHNLAELHFRERRVAEALTCAERAYLAAPGDPAQIVAFARLLAETDPEQARTVNGRALALAPEFLPAGELAARLDLARGEDRKAFADMAARVRRLGKDPAALLALARVLGTAGRFDQALQSIDEALAQAPGSSEARALRIECLFSLGRFAECWGDAAGTPPAIAAIVIPAVMPIGEVVLSARFLPCLTERRDSPLAVMAHPGIASLLAGVPGISFGDGDERAPSDALLLPEIMAHLRVDAATSGALPPYLAPDPLRKAAWSKALASLPGPRIGILWHPAGQGLGLASLVEAARGLGTPVSLAIGELRRELEACPDVIDAGVRIAEPHDLLAAIAALDLVVAPDSLAAHLAGALGRPGVVFVPAGRHWAWAEQDGRCLWYPTVDVLTQAKPGDWTAVASHLADSLAAVLARTPVDPA